MLSICEGNKLILILLTSSFRVDSEIPNKESYEYLRLNIIITLKTQEFLFLLPYPS